MQAGSAPCYLCPVRRVTENFNCHSVCDKYRAFRELLEKKRAEEAIRSEQINHAVRTRQRIMKRRNRKQ